MQTQEMPEVTVRNFRPGDEKTFLELLKNSSGLLGYLPRKNWHEIRYLAVKNGDSRVPLAQNLVYKARHYAESNHAESLSAFVPAIQPYVDVYKNAGFEPVRRSIRIGWELIEQPTEHRNVRTEELSKEHANEAVQVWVEGHRP